MRRPRGPRGQTGCGPWGPAATLQSSHGCGLTAGGGPSLDLVLMSPGRAQEASQLRPEVSTLSLSACSDSLLQKVGHRFLSWVSHDSWLQIGLRTLFSQFPPEMEFTSHFWSVHELLQSTYSVAGIGATQQKYTHDPSKPIFCRWLENSDSAKWRHQMLTFNYFFKKK